MPFISRIANRTGVMNCKINLRVVDVKQFSTAWASIRQAADCELIICSRTGHIELNIFREYDLRAHLESDLD